MSKNFSLEDKRTWDFHQLENRQSFHLATPRLRFLVKQIAKIKNGKCVLDIGFGDGQLLRMLAPFSLALAGIDISEKNVEETKREFADQQIRVELKVGSIVNIPFGDKMFDIVVATEVLEHTDDLELQKGLKEIKRVLKDEGVFMGTVPAYENLDDDTCFCPKCGNVFHRWGHKQSFSETKIKDIFQNCFESVDIGLITFFWQDKPEGSLLKTIKFYIKIVTFYLTKRILGATYWFYFRTKR